MEGFCRGCLIKYDEPMELLQYTEKNRRLFVYSTGLQVKRNDTFTFQLCKDCFLSMKQACKFKKNCRTSDKRFKNYLALKDVGDPVDFCTFLKNNDDTMTFRLPMTSGNSTPATQKCRDDDNESTCTSIRNFMTDILQGEEMPDTEARIIKEVIEEEADVLDDSLDSHWLQDDMSIDTDFRLDLSFSPFSTPHSVNNDHCYTPLQRDDQVTFNTINTEKQTKILKDFTNAFKPDENIEELSFFVGAVKETESFNNLKELGPLISPLSIDEIDGMGETEADDPKTHQNLKELITDLEIDEIDAMDTSHISDPNLCDFGIEEMDIINKNESMALESNQNVKELCNFAMKEIDSIVNSKSIALKSNNSLKEFMSDMAIEENDDVGKHKSKADYSDKSLKELINSIETGKIDVFEKSDNNSDKNLKEFCDFSLDSFSGADKAEDKTHKPVQSLKELCDFSLDSIGSIEKPASITDGHNQSLKELLDLSLNSFDDSAKSETNTLKNTENVKELDLSLNDFDDVANSGSNTFKTSRDIQEICDFGIDEVNENEKSESNLDLPLLTDVLERDKMDTPDFDLPKVDDVGNSGSNTFKTGRNIQEICDFGIDEGKENEKSASNLDLPLLPEVLEREKMDTPDFDLPKGVRSVQSQNDVSNSSMNIEALLEDKQPCTIDKNLEDALKNSDSKQFSLDDLLVPSPVLPVVSAASTPTIANILFGEKLDTPEDSNKIEQCIDSYHDVEIFEEFFQNDTKEFDLEDMKRVNEGYTFKEWKTPIAIKDTEYDNEENKSNNTYMDVSIDIKDLVNESYDALVKSKIEMKECILETTPNDKFDIQNLHCKLCDVKYSNKKALSVHFSKRHKIKIVKIKSDNYKVAVIEPKKEVILDISDMPPNDNFDIEKFHCNLCKIKFDSVKELSAHVSKTHLIKSEKPKSQALLHASEASITDKVDLENLHCKLCDKKYNTGRALSVHFSKTHNLKIVKTKIGNGNTINTPITECKKEIIEYISDTSPNDKFDKEELYCKLCKKKFISSRALSIHFSITHNIKIVKPDYDRKSNQKNNLCTHCGEEQTDSTNFARHVKVCKLRNTKGEFKCEYCNQEFTTQFNLKKHSISHTKLKKKEPTGKPIVCTICGVVLHRTNNLVLHMRRHNKDYIANCTYCNKGFYRQSDLKVHLRSHTGDTPFTCTFCPRLFARRDVLLRHLRQIHIKEKLFHCDYCGLKCVKKYDLIKHITNKSCRKELKKKVERKKKSKKKENMDVDIPVEKEESVEGGKQEVDERKGEVEERQEVEVRKEEVGERKEDVEVGNEEVEEAIAVKDAEVEVIVLYATGSNATISCQLPFLETERSN